MYNLLLNTLHGFLAEALGEAARAALIEDNPELLAHFDPSSDFAEEQIEVLLEIAAKELHLPLEDIYERFGKFIVRTILPTAIARGVIPPDWKSMDLLEQLTLAILPGLSQAGIPFRAPKMRILRPRYGEIALAWFESGALCPLLHGMIQGVGEQFKEMLTIREPVCRRSGAPLCRMTITLTDPSLLNYVDIPREFGQAKEQQESVTLFCQFMGVPLTFPAKVIAFNEKEVLLQAPPTQLATLREQAPLYLSLPHLPTGVAARVKEVKPGHGLVILQQVHLAEGAVGRRDFVRVEPEQQIDVLLHTERRRFAGRLINISVGGASVELSAGNAGLMEQLFSHVRLQFALPQHGGEKGGQGGARLKSVEIEGDLLELEDKGKNTMVRILFSSTSQNSTPLIAQYVKQRQEEIFPKMMELAPGKEAKGATKRQPLSRE